MDGHRAEILLEAGAVFDPLGKPLFSRELHAPRQMRKMRRVARVRGNGVLDVQIILTLKLWPTGDCQSPCNPGSVFVKPPLRRNIRLFLNAPLAELSAWVVGMCGVRRG